MNHIFAHRLKISIMLLTLGTIWGIGPAITKLILIQGTPTFGYTFWQFLGPAIILSIITIITKQVKLSKHHLYYYLVCGLVGLAIPTTTLHIAATKLPAGLIPIILNIVPIFVYPLALVTKQEKLSGYRILGIVIGILGLIIMLYPKLQLQQQTSWFWPSIVLIAPLCFAINAIFINPFKPKNTSSICLAAGMLVVGSIAVTPIMLYHQSFYPISFPFNNVDYAILSKIIMHSISYIIFFQLIKSAGAVFYSMTSFVVIASGLLWGYIFFNEMLNLLQITGVVCIIIALTIMNLTQTKQQVS